MSKSLIPPRNQYFKKCPNVSTQRNLKFQNVRSACGKKFQKVSKCKRKVVKCKRAQDWNPNVVKLPLTQQLLLELLGGGVHLTVSVVFVFFCVSVFLCFCVSVFLCLCIWQRAVGEPVTSESSRKKWACLSAKKLFERKEFV